ncbi:MAG TPA: exodeoxyribonuclease VII small subunit [Saprospiraceae bacterium]|nr:exodeoxyribonuclease VII small subunit [Saprospiraceae bacterium]
MQQIVEALENGNINIDELAAQTERAAELIRFCQEKLRQTEERIQRLFD